VGVVAATAAFLTMTETGQVLNTKTGQLLQPIYLIADHTLGTSTVLLTTLAE
jgi:hypothetical protein